MVETIGKKEVRTLKADGLASAPSAPVEGEMYYDSVDKVYKYHNGTAWKDLSGNPYSDNTDVSTNSQYPEVLKGSIVINTIFNSCLVVYEDYETDFQKIAASCSGDDATSICNYEIHDNDGRYMVGYANPTKDDTDVVFACGDGGASGSSVKGVIYGDGQITAATTITDNGDRVGYTDPTDAVTGWDSWIVTTGWTNSIVKKITLPTTSEDIMFFHGSYSQKDARSSTISTETVSEMWNFTTSSWDTITPIKSKRTGYGAVVRYHWGFLDLYSVDYIGSSKEVYIRYYGYTTTGVYEVNAPSALTMYLGYLNPQD